MVAFFNDFLIGEDGQSLTEYGLILALFVIAAVGSMMLLEPKISGLFADVNEQIN